MADESQAPTHSETSPEEQERARKVALAIATALDESNCEDILVLDVRRLSQVTDFLVIASGASDRQMRTAARKAEEAAEELGDGLFRQNADTATTWVVLDFVNVVAHIFEPTVRGYYDLEMLWGDAERLEWPRADQRKRRNGPPPGARS
ncbi:MAG: ribosome silencing factor [Planctomycetota bacterium]|nr:ribosome silencing factor [Planctomycetota bacterium]